MCQVFLQKLEHQFNWPIGSGISVAEKQLCRHLSLQTTGQNSLALTAQAYEHNGSIHQFKELLIWFCEY
jgi:hypothetical protein